ncbi:hypothetical protein OSB04_017869 [Centaurea solstitialis]|uniref:Integrase catalytic domain-containing protein n=1 Tax=Centaurea solstitialis TaxID=347529 RepID=A0AA38T5C9_9ASTR|nr:hypothetical protein OSB04_017869 [Centaurea solstitialis]
MDESGDKSSRAENSATSTAAFVDSGKCFVSSPSNWIIDSGASDHMTGNHSLLCKFNEHRSFHEVEVANGSILQAIGSGTVRLSESMSLSSVLCLPKFTFNLLSVSKITRTLNCSVKFYPYHCIFKDLSTKQIIGRGRESGGLYIFEPEELKSQVALASLSPFELHCRLGHPSLQSLKRLYPQLSHLSSLNCNSCQFAKHHRVHLIPKDNKRAASLFELVHSDVWGPCPVTSKSGFKYFVTFVDDFSRVTWLYLMKNRSEVFTHFCTFVAEAKTQFGVSVKTLRSDNAKEYTSETFRSFMLQQGIRHESSCVDTPSQNGVAERKNRHLLEVARALLFQMTVPKPFWADAIATACFLINRMPSSVLHGEIPMSVLVPGQRLFPIEPKIFGCSCFVRDTRPHLSKLDPKSLKCVFLGYSRLQKGYRCFSPVLNRYIVSRDVTFMEEVPFYPVSTCLDHENQDDLLIYPIPTPSSTVDFPVPSDSAQSSEPSSETERPPVIHVYSRQRRPTSEPSVVPSADPSSNQSPHLTTDIPNSDVRMSESPSTSDSDTAGDSLPPDLDVPIALRKGKRSCTYPVDSYVSYAKLSTASRSLVASLDSIPTPKTVGDALAHPGWRNAMIEEMNALEHSNTWTLVELPANKKAIGCKWVFTVKVNPDGSVARLKARLVAKGYAQTYGVDYSETFSPVAKVPSIRLFISLAATYNWGESRRVCKLRKSLYGLKQSPRAWFGRFNAVVTEFGLRRSAYDHSVFFASSSSGCILLVVYVDDIVITGSDETGIMKLKDFLASQFQTKDLGPLKYFLGIEVSRNRKGICLSQRKYCLDILNDSGMIETKPCEAPMIPNMKLNVKDGDLLEDPEKYRRIVGKLNYLTITRPDIAFPVSVVSQFMSSPRTPHWDAVRHILKYLKGAPGLGILYQNHNHHVIEGFTDADYDGDPTNRRSTTGYCVFVGGNLVSWKSKKQNVVSRSSAESEYRAMAQTTCELIWLRNLLGELGFAQSKPMNLYCDNEAAIHIANNPVFHERTKHIEVDCHFTREKLEDGTISTPFVRTGSQLADVFTKALPGSRVSICNKLGMINIYAPA